MFRHRLTQFTTHVFSLAIVWGMLECVASATEIISRRSGYDEVSSAPYSVGAVDANVRVLSKVGGQPLSASPFTLADFQTAQSAGNSTVIPPLGSSLSNPNARWIKSGPTARKFYLGDL